MAVRATKSVTELPLPGAPQETATTPPMSYVSTFSFSAVLASCMATASLTPMIQVGLHLLGDSVDFESVANCMTLVRICHHSKRGSSDLRQDSLK